MMKTFDQWWNEHYPNTEKTTAYYTAKRAFEFANEQAWDESDRTSAFGFGDKVFNIVVTDVGNWVEYSMLESPYSTFGNTHKDNFPDEVEIGNTYTIHLRGSNVIGIRKLKSS